MDPMSPLAGHLRQRNQMKGEQNRLHFSNTRDNAFLSASLYTVGYAYSYCRVVNDQAIRSGRYVDQPVVHPATSRI